MSKYIYFAREFWSDVNRFNPLTVTPIFENSRESAVSKLKLL